jgi:hypothetical protein
MEAKEMVVTIVAQEHLKKDWFFDFTGRQFCKFFEGLVQEMSLLGVNLARRDLTEPVIVIKSYNDLLNCLKISSLKDGHANQCVGHIIGASPNLNIMEDLRTAVRRVAFAPETIAPDAAFRKVCHNCGCGC